VGCGGDRAMTELQAATARTQCPVRARLPGAPSSHAAMSKRLGSGEKAARQGRMGG